MGHIAKRYDISQTMFPRLYRYQGGQVNRKNKIIDIIVKIGCNCIIYVREINEFNHDILMKKKE